MSDYEFCMRIQPEPDVLKDKLIKTHQLVINLRSFRLFWPFLNTFDFAFTYHKMFSRPMFGIIFPANTSCNI